MINLLRAAALALLVLPSAAQAEDVPFFTLNGDTATHTPSGGTCPAEFAGMKRYKLQSLNDQGLDAGCQFGTPGGDVLSIYFTDFGADSLAKVVADSERAMQGRMQMSINQEMSDYCDNALDKALADQSARLGGAATPEADCAIVANDKVTSLLMAERIGRWTVKVRLSTRSTGAEVAASVMQAGGVILQAERETIKGQ